MPYGSIGYGMGPYGGAGFMANYTCSFAAHQTLASSTVDTVTMSATSTDPVLIVINRTGTNEIYFTIGTTGTPPAVPTVGGNDCYVIPASVTYLSIPFAGPGSVKLISSGAMAYSVIGL